MNGGTETEAAAELIATIFFCLLAFTLATKVSQIFNGPATLVWMKSSSNL